MKKKLIPIFASLGVVVLIVAIIGISVLVNKYSPSKERLNLSEYFNITSDDQVAIILDNELNETQAKLINDNLYLDYQFVHDFINPRFYWDPNENILLYATQRDLVSVNADSNTYQITKSTADYGKTIVKATSDSAYIEIGFLKLYSDFSFEFFKDPSRVVITTDWGDVDTASIKKNTQVRYRGGIKSEILTDVTKGDSITVLEKGDNWDQVVTSDGIVGYIRSKYLSDTTKETLKSDFVEETFSHITRDSRICMAWHQVTATASNSSIASILSSTKGINVISPTWFYLNDNKGNLADLASKDYINYCHQQGVEVWALVNNLDNPDVDSTYVLTHTSIRHNLVNQIIANAIKYELDGINLDFEALNGSEVGDAYIQFVRELSIKCGNNGIVLSVDNYVPMEYTAFYNRAEQAKFADYVIIMGYDEHYVGSDEGSVSSLSWVKKGVEDTLKEVPESQTILGMPFYTRLWQLTPKQLEDNTDVTDDSDPQFDITSTVYGMNGGASVVESFKAETKWLDDAGQNYAEWQDGETTYKIWLEDIQSTEARLELVDSYKLAGASFWKLGLEKNEVWDTIIKYVN